MGTSHHSRPKPQGISDEMWMDFEKFCKQEGIGIAEEDWMPWWLAYYAGYEFRCAENLGALA